MLSNSLRSLAFVVGAKRKGNGNWTFTDAQLKEFCDRLSDRCLDIFEQVLREESSPKIASMSKVRDGVTEYVRDE